MEDELLHKLRKTLDSGITEEEQVVYLLVESRKLMDRQRRLTHPTFRMFANWIAHVELSVPSKPLAALLKAFEREYVEERINGRKWRTTDYENFRILRTSMREFLVNACLPTRTVDDEEAWLLFAMKYSQVVSDCPITLKAPQMPHLDKVELGKAGLVLSVNGQELVNLRWKITPHKGKALFRSIGIEGITIQVPPKP